MADFLKILQQAQQMQGKLQQMQEELQHRTVHGAAGRRSQAAGGSEMGAEPRIRVQNVSVTYRTSLESAPVVGEDKTKG